MQKNVYDKAIISDASCLIALTNINRLEILKQLFKEIIITPEVASEYKLSLPKWILIKDVLNKNMIAEIRKNKLGIGESSSIALAMENKNSVLILDDDQARNFVRKNGLVITGTLSIIRNACDLGYIESYEAVCDDLRKANFRFSKKVQEEVKKNTVNAQPTKEQNGETSCPKRSRGR